MSHIAEDDSVAFSGGRSGCGVKTNDLTRARRMLKSLNQLDRRSFWLWAIPIVGAHWLLSIAMANGMNVGPLGPMDTLLILLLAAALAGRFRDIGWPTWIGSSFLIATLLVLPVVAFLCAIASGDKPLEYLRWMMLTGQFTGPANTLLMIVAGCVPGRQTAAARTTAAEST